jgi:S-formylglutathione hydrolase FrmB
MGLTSTALVVAVTVLAIAVPALALLTWNRVHGPVVVRMAQRLSLVVVAQGLAVLMAFLTVNHQYLFFTSWQDLLGTPPTMGGITALNDRSVLGPVGNLTVSFQSSTLERNGGRLITETVHGNRSGLTGRVLIHLPAGYSAGSRTYPVLELLQGWHSPPESWITNLHAINALDQAAASGALGPVIAVMPDINLAAPRDVECTNVPHGPQAETWLTADVRDLVLGSYRASPLPTSWSLAGFSTGGYCAAKILLHHPQWYRSAAVLSGYFEAIRDRTTGDLWGGSQRLRDENSPLWLATRRVPPPVDLLAFASRYDTDSYPSTAAFLRQARPPLRLFSLIAPRGGHNFKALRLALPAVLSWIGDRLNGTASPAPAQARPPSRFLPEPARARTGASG